MKLKIRFQMLQFFVTLSSCIGTMGGKKSTFEAIGGFVGMRGSETDNITNFDKLEFAIFYESEEPIKNLDHVMFKIAGVEYTNVTVIWRDESKMNYVLFCSAAASSSEEFNYEKLKDGIELWIGRDLKFVCDIKRNFKDYTKSPDLLRLLTLNPNFKNKADLKILVKNEKIAVVIFLERFDGQDGIIMMGWLGVFRDKNNDVYADYYRRFPEKWEYCVIIFENGDIEVICKKNWDIPSGIIEQKNNVDYYKFGEFDRKLLWLQSLDSRNVFSAEKWWDRYNREVPDIDKIREGISMEMFNNVRSTIHLYRWDLNSTLDKLSNICEKFDEINGSIQPRIKSMVPQEFEWKSERVEHDLKWLMNSTFSEFYMPVKYQPFEYIIRLRQFLESLDSKLRSAEDRIGFLKNNCLLTEYNNEVWKEKIEKIKIFREELIIRIKKTLPK